MSFKDDIGHQSSIDRSPDWVACPTARTVWPVRYAVYHLRGMAGRWG